MDVFLANEQGLPLDETRLMALASHTLSTEDVDDEAELSILVIDAEHMRTLNARFASNDYATDVLAFPMMEEDDDALILGDVVLCPEVAAGNAQRLKRTLESELDVLVVHGTLHLLGYDHQGSTDKARMETRVRAVLESFTGAP